MAGRVDETVSEAKHAGVGAPVEGEMYAVYNLTPNMWEEPWVRHLLGDLPISRYEIRDLWSPPPPSPRKRKIAIFLESLLPSALRPHAPQSDESAEAA
jgi:hypothetical protein